jgi:para-nitrobenzyl esterase
MKAQMKILLLPALLAFALTGPAAAQTPTPQAKTESGTVRGAVEGKISVFRGIPFAAPPVGALRWEPPKPAARWEVAREAVKNSVSCMQKMSANGAPNGGGASGPMGEDCLYLNVFAPAGAKKTPVMVWLHGGANTLGSGVIYDMKPFARDGVIVVSINYRLGAFGFFAHPALSKAAAADAPLGNYGLMDQLAGLAWVKRNIANFGGDPNNVTVFGESAGAMDILALLAIPESKGLFNKAIMESNIGWGTSTPLARAEQNGAGLATKLGAPADATAAQLRGLSADAINAAGGGVQTIVDGRMVKESTGEAWDKGHILDVPLIVGNNSYEASLQRSQQPQADLFTNGQGVAPARWIARQEASGAPSYMYFFSYVRDSDRATAIGAAHASEIPYAHDTLPRPTLPAPSAGDQAVATQMHSCWVAFAKTGKPACASGPAWPAYDPKTDQLYEFAAKPDVQSHFRQAELDAAEANRNAPRGAGGRAGG